ncbi:MAG: hypothetical protein KGH61_04425 [Candidatus Micrarchaeota archaeon]|nr:hypothetical protein [Candidatus Micrarchaeota archaeon]MDE1848164.1 hypothetical protein [Candidatus Micrarchaeota archaeon]MDE1864648.1 hypothetical protein [Candidatus Micrarchaeota archaeon]
MQIDQFTAIAVTSITFVLSVGLSYLMTRSYLKMRSVSRLFWGLGLWIFAISVLIELVFSLGAYSALLMQAYLVLVALLVQLLAVGSVSLLKNQKVRYAYYAFTIFAAVLVVYSVAASSITDLIMNYVVGGIPPNLVIYASTIATVPATFAIIIVAALSYLKKRDWRMLSVIVGVITVAIAGTLYVVSLPALLYLAEFIGIVLLWLGFIGPEKKWVLNC